MNGFINLYKTAGMSSFKAIAALRKITGEKKVGHTGTLDPMATGVLPATVGRASKYIDYIPDRPKGYTASFRLGFTTDTLDITGTVTGEYPVNADENDVMEALGGFVGEIRQIPPMYSALSKDGVKLYDLARKGIEIERESRAVTVHGIEYLGCEDGVYSVSVSCSKGTYIRTLIDDLGRVLGCGACMTSLVRTASNGFLIADAHTAEELEKMTPAEYLIPVEKIMSPYPEIILSDGKAKRFLNGGALDADRLGGIPAESPFFRIYNNENVFLGLGEISEDGLKARVIELL